MRSASDFFPSFMTVAIKCATSGAVVAGIELLVFFVNFTSCGTWDVKLKFEKVTSSSSAVVGRRAGLRTLRAIFRTAAAALIDPERVERAAHDVITHTGQILHPSAAHEHDGVFLQIVSFAAECRR